MNCCVLCSSKDIDIDFLKQIDFSEHYIICADGGMKIAEEIGLNVDLWLGDMDSYKSSDITKDNIETKLYPADKDFTDSHLAATEAMKMSPETIYFIGATGGRLDHEYSNYCLLKFILKKGYYAEIIDKNNRIFMTDKSCTIYPEGKKYISFFPFGGIVEKFNVKNAKYELENYCLSDDETYTVSNEFIENNPVKIEFSDGYVLVICSNDV